MLLIRETKEHATCKGNKKNIGESELNFFVEVAGDSSTNTSKLRNKKHYEKCQDLSFIFGEE